MHQRRELSEKICHTYDPSASRKVYETAQKEKIKLLEKLRPSKPINVLKEASTKGQATMHNSLRMRKKGLSAKIGQSYDKSASMKAYEDSSKEQRKIRDMRKPMKPNNPIAEDHSKIKNASPKNSLRMRHVKALSSKIPATYDPKASRDSFESTSKEWKQILAKVKPVKPRNPLSEKEEKGKSTKKNSLRMRQKQLSSKINAYYSEKDAQKSYEDSQKEAQRICKRAHASRNPLSDGKAYGNSKPKFQPHLKKANKQLSAKVGATCDLEQLRINFEDMRKEKAKIMARVKPVRPRNPLTG